MSNLRFSGGRKPPRRFLLAALGVGVVLLGAALATPALTDVISVPEPSRVLEKRDTLAIDNLKPDECATLTVTELRSGGNPVTAGPANSLLLANSSTTAMVGGSGDDCIVGNSAVATIDGGAGINICIGGPSTAFTRCASTGGQEIRRA